MVAVPADYPWSSYGSNALGRGDRVVSGNEVYLDLGRTPTLRQATYRALFQQALSDVLEQVRRSTRMDWPLGDERFKSQIESIFHRRVACNTWGGARSGAGRKPMAVE
jgi:putative transposase